MATTARNSTKSQAKKKPAATQAKSGAGDAMSEHSKDARKSFGKAAPKRVAAKSANGSSAHAARAKAPSKKKSIVGKALGAVSGAAGSVASAAGSVVSGVASLVKRDSKAH